MSIILERCYAHSSSSNSGSGGGNKFSFLEQPIPTPNGGTFLLLCVLTPHCQLDMRAMVADEATTRSTSSLRVQLPREEELQVTRVLLVSSPPMDAALKVALLTRKGSLLLLDLTCYLDTSTLSFPLSSSGLVKGQRSNRVSLEEALLLSRVLIKEELRAGKAQAVCMLLLGPSEWEQRQQQQQQLYVGCADGSVLHVQLQQTGVMEDEAAAIPEVRIVCETHTPELMVLSRISPSCLLIHTSSSCFLWQSEEEQAEDDQVWHDSNEVVACATVGDVVCVSLCTETKSVFRHLLVEKAPGFVSLKPREPSSPPQQEQKEQDDNLFFFSLLAMHERALLLVDQESGALVARISLPFAASCCHDSRGEALLFGTSSGLVYVCTSSLHIMHVLQFDADVVDITRRFVFTNKDLFRYWLDSSSSSSSSSSKSREEQEDEKADEENQKQHHQQSLVRSCVDEQSLSQLAEMLWVTALQKPKQLVASLYAHLELALREREHEEQVQSIVLRHLQKCTSEDEDEVLELLLVVVRMWRASQELQNHVGVLEGHLLKWCEKIACAKCAFKRLLFLHRGELAAMRFSNTFLLSFF